MTVATTHYAGTSDYTDAMTLTLADDTQRPAIDWAREIIERSPRWLRLGLPPGWRVLGVRLAPTHAPDHVHGWPIVSQTHERVVLGAASRLGFDARLSVVVEPGSVRFATTIRHNSPLSRPLWAGIGVPHRVLVAHMMRHAAAHI